MINRKQVGNVEKLTRILNEISGRTDNTSIKIDLSAVKTSTAALQQDKITVSDKMIDFEKRITAIENKLKGA